MSEWALSLIDWTRDAGALGVVVFVVAYVVAALALLPGSILTIGAGLVYGPIFGTLLVSPVSVLAATAAFLVGRGVARAWVTRRMERHPRFALVDRAIGANGFKIVALLRLSPIFPYNILNYALALTRVRLHDFVAASFIGMLPGTLLFVYIGSLASTASEIVAGKRPAAGSLETVFFWGGLVATVVAAVVVTRVARKALGNALTGEVKP
ncbi:MAG: TVP38/TMEM64 family protein [Deltaproteobacteria bacterium]|nr:TVP38/TMEM64 family protein [Deltaproteobacteria bacterium]